MDHGRRIGLPGIPVAFQTRCGWVLAGGVTSHTRSLQLAVHHASLLTADDLIRKFWKIKVKSKSDHLLTHKERIVLEKFKTHHSHLSDIRFIVPLPHKRNVKPLGESRSQAVRRFQSFERSLHAKGKFQEFKAVINEHLESDHAEEEVLYLPMHCQSQSQGFWLRLMHQSVGENFDGCLA